MREKREEKSTVIVVGIYRSKSAINGNCHMAKNACHHYASCALR